MENSLLLNVLGILLVITGILDAFKYSWQAKKIRWVQSAKGHSRNFINVAIGNDFIRIIYLCLHWDWYLLISSLIAMICMLDMWYAMYVWYPYRKRGLLNFKRPSMLKYIWNSFLPNKFRKRL